MRGWSAGGETLGPGQRWQGWCETAVRGKSACVGGRAQGTGRETERWEHRWAQSRNWRGTGGYSYKIQLTKNPDACRQPRSNKQTKAKSDLRDGRKKQQEKIPKAIGTRRSHAPCSADKIIWRQVGKPRPYNRRSKEPQSGLEGQALLLCEKALDLIWQGCQLHSTLYVLFSHIKWDTCVFTLHPRK